jgi:AcrR family transcriptional regulator
MTATSTRQTADERRAQVLRAAIAEFAEHGLHAARTTAIAERAGISQPYIYALFPNKRDLFLACHEHAMGRIRDAFTEAARGAASPDDALERMGDAYMTLLDDREELLFQLQGHAAAGDPDIQAVGRRAWMDLWNHVRRLSGAPIEAVRGFMAMGMFLNVVAALELPEEVRPSKDEHCPPGELR